MLIRLVFNSGYYWNRHVNELWLTIWLLLNIIEFYKYILIYCIRRYPYFEKCVINVKVKIVSV